MKVLLDEHLDHALRRLLAPHDVVTVAFMGWAGLKNGELLKAAEGSGIDVLLTGDQTLNHEQNLAGRRLAIVALSAIQLPIIRQGLPAILAAIDQAMPGSFAIVDYVPTENAAKPLYQKEGPLSLLNDKRPFRFQPRTRLHRSAESRPVT